MNVPRRYCDFAQRAHFFSVLLKFPTHPVTTPALSTMADHPSFSACLNRLGFDVPTRNLLETQGIRTINDLTNLPFPEIDKMIQHLSRWKPRTAGVADDEDLAPGPTFPYLAVRKFKALRSWADYCILRGSVPNPAQFDDRTTTRFLNRLSELEEIAQAKKDGNEGKEPPKLASMAAWPTWVELFTTYLAQHRSAVAGTPLTYAIRDTDEVAPADLARDDWDSVDDDLVATSVLAGETFARDSKRVFDILKPLVMEGPGWPFVQPFNRKRDGRAAFKALKSQAEGRSAVATRKAKAYAMLATALFTGKGKFSFDQYVGRHQQAHNELLFLEEPVAETKKVTDFLAGIRDAKLETAIQTCMGDEQKLTNFELCQQYFKTIVENTKTRTKSSSDVREISKVGIEKDKKNAKHKKGKSSDDNKLPSGIAIHSGPYSAKDYNKLKPFEKAKVKQLREDAKKKEKKDKSDGRNVAAVSTTPEEVTPQEEDEGTKTPVVSNAGKQFGRAAHGEQQKSA